MQSEAELLEALKGLAEDVGPEGVSEIINLFLTDSKDIVRELRQAVELGDAAGVARAAHSLKSTAATVGAHLLAAHCLEMEKLGRAGRAREASAHLDDVDAECRHVGECLASLRSRIDPANG